MTKRLIAIVLSFLLVHISGETVFAKSNLERESAKAAKVREGIERLGVGEKSIVRLKLRDGAKLQGYVSNIGDESFTVTNVKTGVATVVQYPKVTKVQGNNLSTGAEIAIGVGILVVVALIVVWAAGRSIDHSLER